MNCTKNENIPREIKSNSITDAHRQLMRLVHASGKKVTDERGNETKQVYGVTVRIHTNEVDHPEYSIIGTPNAEQAIYFRDGILDENVANRVANTFDYGYGERLRRCNALYKVVIKFLTNTSSRRTWLPIYTHSDATNGNDEVPCCVGVDFLIHEGKLCMTVVFRSNDIAMAFPSDAVGFMALQHSIADTLQLDVGEYTQFIVSAHYRLSDEDIIEAMLKTQKYNKVRM
jgi:thymidylate synthase